MTILKGLEPYNVFKYFEEISQIPRGSGDEKAISDYLVNFAKERNLEVIQDKAYNVIIKKPATPGYENFDGIIIQGHMDMVNEKNSDVNHDFLNDPIKLIVDGDIIRADGTTLGADNGIAVAMGLALLDSDQYKHPNICFVITSEEETGMDGAFALDGNLIKGYKYFLNIDSDKEGMFIVSCAGGVRQVLEVPTDFMDTPANYNSYAIKVRGLNGGHSGIEISKELANSNRLMGRILNKIFEKYDISLSTISGGLKDNAIPREADAIINVDANDANNVKILVQKLEEELKSEFRATEPNLALYMEEVTKEEKSFTNEVSKKIITAILLIPNGVQAMSVDIQGLVQTSNNLGVIVTEKDKVVLTSASRSSVLSSKHFLQDQIRLIAELIGAKYLEYGNYPGWAYEPKSKLRDTCVEIYSKMYNTKAEVEAIHAGLECGLFSEKVPGLDIISFGPNITAQHTPEEKLSISSTERVWNFLVNVLENLK